jgi:hypothetical protein
VPRVRSGRSSVVIICLFLGGGVLLNGCNSSSSVSETEQSPPQNRVEGLQRIGEANKKHDQETASAKKPKR